MLPHLASPIRHKEPVLLVGETGTGKTTVCQLLALLRGHQLHILNCNQHTETSDFLGGFRPARGREAAAAAFLAAAKQVAGSALYAATSTSPPAVELPADASELAAPDVTPLVKAVRAAAAAALAAADAGGAEMAEMVGAAGCGSDAALWLSCSLLCFCMCSLACRWHTTYSDTAQGSPLMLYKLVLGRHASSTSACSAVC
jgi:hypothetical protein